jgi:putative spermidine/putrescine transport system permease protein
MKRQGIAPHLGQALSLVYLGLVYAFILGPMVVVIVSSFNSASAFPSPFESFSLRWYSSLVRHDEFMESMWVSTRVAVLAATMATLLGIPLSFFLVRAQFRGKGAINAFFLSPLVIPHVALSIALLQMFSLIGVRLGQFTLVLAHTVIIMPFVIRAVMASLHFVNPAMEESAMNLGANRLQTFLYVTLPLIRAGVTAGFVLAFIISFINVPLSLFLTTPGTTTLPIRVFSYMQSRLDPLVAAVGSLTIFGVTIVAIFLERVLKVRLIL